jgi:hypothetical protein
VKLLAIIASLAPVELDVLDVLDVPVVELAAGFVEVMLMMIDPSDRDVRQTRMSSPPTRLL